MHPVKNVKFNFLIMAVVTFCTPLAFVEAVETALFPCWKELMQSSQGNSARHRNMLYSHPVNALLRSVNSAPPAGDLKGEHF